MPGFSPRQLRERLKNYLSPTLNTSSWTDDEDAELLRLHAELGRQWGIIARRMGNRSPPDVKNRFQAIVISCEKRSRQSGRRVPGRTTFDISSESQHKFPGFDIWTLPRLQAVESPMHEAPFATAKCPQDFSIKSLLIEES
jgi:hypothetical protein